MKKALHQIAGVVVLSESIQWGGGANGKAIRLSKHLHLGKHDSFDPLVICCGEAMAAITAQSVI
jgi:hypothetical protein